MKSTIIYLLFFFTNTLLGLNNIDSLATILEKANTLQEKLDAYQVIVEELEYGKEQALFDEYLFNYVQLAEKEKDTLHLARAFESKAINQFFKNNLSDAAITFEKAYVYYQTVHLYNEAYMCKSKVGVMNTNQGDFAKAEEIYREILKNTRIDSLRLARAQVTLNMGSMYFYQRLLDSAEVYYIESKDLYIELNDSLSATSVMNNLAGIHFMRGETDKTLEILLDIKDIRERGTPDEALIKLYSTLGITYSGLGQLDEALTYCIKGYHLADEINYVALKSKFLIQISELYDLNNDYSGALDFAERAIAENGEEFLDIKVYGYKMKGQALEGLDNIDEAIASYLLGLALINDKSIGNAYKAEIEISLADAYLTNGELQKAKNILLPLENDATINPIMLDNLNRVMASIYWKEGNADKAIAHGTKAFDGFINSENYRSSSGLANVLSKAYERKRNYKKSLYYSQQYQALRDSVYNLDKVRELTKQTKDFEFTLEKQKLEADQREEEARLKAETYQARMWTVGLGGVGLVSFLSFLFVRRKNQTISRQKYELDKMMNIKDQIFTIVGHDLRKPSIAFSGLSKKINYLLKKKDFESLEKLGDQIEHNGFALEKLIDNLLNWSLVQRDILPTKPQPVYLLNLSKEIEAILQTRLDDKNISLSNEINEHHVALSDRSALHTALFNLLDNAVKYSQPGGEIALSSYVDKGTIKIKVSDTGKGMSADQLRDIFVLKDNKSTKGTSGESGTGLGLHIAYELIKKNKGAIQVSSELNQGTNFVIELPTKSRAA